MKIAVAGGFGFLGANVVSKLLSHGYNAIPFSRQNGIDIIIPGAAEKYLREINPDVVINCAADLGGIAYNALYPVRVYEDNTMIGFNLIKACYSSGVKKLVNIMPNCTYPGVADIYRESEWWNGEMHDTVLTYGMPRKTVWVQCWAYKQKFGFDSIHIVLPNLYGPRDHFDPIRSHALGALIKKIVDAKQNKRMTVEIWGTGSPIREWGYVIDAAEGIVLAMEKYNDINIMNLGEGKGYTIKEIAEMIKELVGWEGQFVYDATRPDGAPKKILDVAKMKKILGWQPKTPLTTGIKKTVEWFLENSSEGK